MAGCGVCSNMASSGDPPHLLHMTCTLITGQHPATVPQPGTEKHTETHRGADVHAVCRGDDPVVIVNASSAFRVLVLI